MSQIDKFFKSKLEERSFTEDDQSWQEMQLLLNDQDNDRPKLGWLFSFLGFAMLSTMVWVNVAASKQALVHTATVVGNGQQQIKTTTENPFQYLTDIKAKETTQVQDKVQAPTQAQANTATQPQTQSPTQKQTLAQTQIQSQAQTQANTATQSLTELYAPVQAQEKVQAQTNDEVQSSRSNQVQSEKQIQVQTPKAKPESVVEAALKTPEVSSQKDDELSSISEVLSLEKTAELKTMKTVDLLESKFNFLLLEEKDDFRLPGKIITTKRYQTIRLGLGVEQGILLPFSAANQINITAIGPVLQFPINQRWSIFSGLQYKYFSAKTFGRDTVVVEDYSFGLERSTFADRVKSIHYLSIQTLIQRKINRFAIGLGFELDALLGTHGELEASRNLQPWESVGGDEPLTAITTSKGTLGKSRLNKWLIAPQLQFNYTLARNAELSFGLSYQLANYFDNGNTIESSPAPIPTWNSQRLQCQLGLNYYFFNWKKEIK